MTTKPTRDTVEEMLNDFEAHELIGSRRDVYELVVSVFRGYLALEEELGGVKGELDAERIVLNYHSRRIGELEAENEALMAKLEGTFKFDEPKRGESLRYVTDDETGVARVKWETDHE